MGISSTWSFNSNIHVPPKNLLSPSSLTNISEGEKRREMREFFLQERV